MQGIIGKKIGMTQVFDDEGRQVPVTVLEVGPCVVVQRKRQATDGYEAVQVGFIDQKKQRLSKAALTRFEKAGVAPKRELHEFIVDASSELKEGDEVKADFFDGTEFVDVSGVTKGRGFQGVVRRYRMGGGLSTHGSMSHRRIGSIGQNTSPARVFKGKKLPGQMGNVNRTQLNLKVIQVRPEDNAILVRGAVPGPNGGLVVVRKAVKKAAKAS